MIAQLGRAFSSLWSAVSSQIEERYYCIGNVGGDILTVRFTHRHNTIRIIGAGYWRKGRELYEEQNEETNQVYE